MRIESGELQVPLPLVLQFGLVLCRTTGLLTFLPIPGLRMGFDVHRLVLGILFAVLLLPWSGNATAIPSVGEIAKTALSEAALGTGLGLCVALIQEGIQLGAHMIGLQAGFSYASTIDPTSNADSAIIQVLLSLGSAMLFLAMGFDTVLFRFLLAGVQTVAPGHWTLTPQHASAVMALFPQLFSDAIRCAIPVVAILFVIDTALALLSRIQPQLQLLSLSFPLKMLASMVLLAVGTPMLPAVVERAAVRSLAAMQMLMGGPR
ncbi:MAG: flagellar biosynthetic protein FliR [Acidobacteria bacterium]|nr:flagellar biosynthetic protein FliR [Acidobacteriota bacterium]